MRWSAPPGARTAVERQRVRGPSSWATLTPGTPERRLRFRGAPGETYRFRLRAYVGGNAPSRAVEGAVTVPVDERSRAVRRSSGWARVARRFAWERGVLRAAHAGRTVRVRVNGRRVVVVGHRSARGGRLEVVVDGRRRAIVSLRGRSSDRRVVYRSARLAAGTRDVLLRSRGGGPVDLDAVAGLP